MKPLAARFVLLLAVGAVINVIVSWAVAIWTASVTFDAQLTAKLRRQRWEAEDRTGEPQVVWLYQALHGTGLDLVFIDHDDPAGMVHLYRAGWPFRAMEGESRPTVTGTPEYTAAIPLNSMVTLRAELVSGQAKVLTSTATRVVPLRPVWLGFLANTVIYAGVATGILGCAWLVRRVYRRWRGRCPACGYDLRGDLEAGCPECGRGKARSHAP